MKAERFSIQRRVVAVKTSEAWQRVPHVGFVYEPDVTDLLSCYRENRELGGVRITLNTVVLRLIAEGLKSAPRLNATVRFDRRRGEGTLQVRDQINIAVPWDKDGVMITPTVFGCESLDLVGLQRAVDVTRAKVEHTQVDELLREAVTTETVRHLRRMDLSYLSKALAGTVTLHGRPGLHGARRREYHATDPSSRLTPEDLLGATVSVSNVGSLMPGVRGHFSMLQIIEPQVFVVGVNPSRQELRDGAVRDVLPLTLVFDHRPLDFSDLVPFIRRCDELLADMVEIRSWFQA